MYFDSAYIAKLYLNESDVAPVRELAADAEYIVASGHARVELAYIFHRKFREGSIEMDALLAYWEQVESDELSGFLRWLPNDFDQLKSAARSSLGIPAECFLRAADALHLACARDHGIKTVYSNDKNLLAAARHFGVRARNVISRTS